MRTNTQGFLNNLTAVIALLRRVTGVHSYDCVSSTFSLGREDSEELSPASIVNTDRVVMVLDHVSDAQVFYDDMMITICVLFCYFELVVSSLPIDLEMGLRGTPRGFTAAMTPLLASTHRTLLTPESLLRCAIGTRVLNRVPFTIGKEDFQTHVNAAKNILREGLGHSLQGSTYTDGCRVS